MRERRDRSSCFWLCGSADRVSSVTATAAGATVATQTYTYDKRNRVSKERVQDGVPATIWERDFSHTAAGLLTQIDDVQEQWTSDLSYGEAGRLSLIECTDNSGATKANPFVWWEGANQVTTDPADGILSIVNGTNRITYETDEESRLVWAQMGTGDPVSITYDGAGALRSVVQGSITREASAWRWFTGGLLAGKVPVRRLR